jgi:hypothetical protein
MAKTISCELKYRGFTITAKREQSLDGEELTYYDIFRDEDGWEMESNFTSGTEDPITLCNTLKGHVDDYIENPEDYDE